MHVNRQATEAFVQLVERVSAVAIVLGIITLVITHFVAVLIGLGALIVLALLVAGLWAVGSRMERLR